MSEPTISLRAIIKDETAAQLQAMAENVKRVTQAFGTAAPAVVEFTHAEKALTPAIKEVTEAQAQATIIIKRHKPEVDAATASTARQSITVEQSAAFVRSQAAAIAETSRRMRESISATQAKMSEEEKLSNALASQIIKLKAQKEFLSDPVYRKSAEQAAQLRHEVDKLNESINSSTKATEKHGITWSEVVSKYYLASQAFGVVKNGLMSLVDAAKQYDSVRARLNAVEGSEVLGGRDFETAQKLAKAPGLGFEQVATMMATLRGMKMTAAETEALIQGIGRANASAAGTADTFGRVMTQISQSISIGKLNVQDLKPIIQAIPTLGAVLEEHYGAITSEALNRKLQESGKSVREFWVEVANLGAQLPAAGDTIANNLDNMSAAWVRLRASITNTSLVKSATSALAGIIDAIAAANDRQTKMEEDRARARKELGDPTSFLEVGKSTSVGGPGSTNEAVARMQETQMLRESLAERLAARKEADARELSDKQKKSEESAQIAKKAAKSERERIAAHNRASEANIERGSDGSVTMRDAMSWNADRTGITGDDEDAAKGYERREAGREKAEKKHEADAKRQAAIDKQSMEDVMKYADAYHKGMSELQDKETKKLQEENDKRLKAEQDYWRAMQSAAESSINSTLQTLIMGGGSMKSKLNALLTQGESSLISSGVSMLMGAAFAPATGGTSLAVPAGMEFLTSIMGVHRASGGQVMGGFIGNEGARGGAEYVIPNAPSRVYNSTQQTTNNVGATTIHIHAGGGNANDIARAVAKVLPRSTRLSVSNRSQTSRSSR